MLSRRMLRGFAAMIAVIAGLQVLGFGISARTGAEQAALSRAQAVAAEQIRLVAEAESLAGLLAANAPGATRSEIDAIADRLLESTGDDPALARYAAALVAPANDADRARARPGLAAAALAGLETRIGSATIAAELASRRAGLLDAALAASGLGLLALVALLILRPILRDVRRVTQSLEEARAKLAHSALHDHLTKLPNRRYVEEHLRRSLAGAGRSGQLVAVLQIDLDGFKQINDRHGHAVGDAALVAVADRMQAAIRRSDFLGRTGGDEFVVIATEARNPRGIETLAQRLIERIGSPVVICGQTCEIGASIGIALSPPLDADCERMMIHADAALYEAKAEGRGSFRLHPDARLFLDIHYPKPPSAMVAARRAG